jgi:primosomal protein N' (replication factor Y)
VEHLILKVALDTPLDFSFDYRWLDDASGPAPSVGQLALVPFGRRVAVGLIVEVARTSDLPADKLKDVLAVRAELAPLSQAWLALVAFAADYYQRPLGEVAIPALPRNLRAPKPTALGRALKKLGQGEPPHDPAPAVGPALTVAQQTAVDAIAVAQGFAPILLYGVTGSGKTEVYLQAAAEVLAHASARREQAQILILVPEINLTPQLEESVRARFPSATVVSLHSGLAEGERMSNWLAAHLGRAHIVLGTRLAVLASLPDLKLIIIDEEHDTSYKQQEGLRYSARDLAVWRARQLSIPVVLGSATPSLESWQHAQSGRYQKLELRARAVKDAILPAVHLIDMARDKPVQGVTSSMIGALKLRLERGEQSLLFLNRRGYAPVLNCDACGWVSSCTRCTSFMVMHKGEQRLRCHHCSLELRIPKSCPTCGNVDLQPLGRGTQRIEESLQEIFPQARILRIDADSTRRKGSAQAAFSSVHQGEVDILVGTQMVAKGHDFKNLTLVGVLNPDTALFSHDYRASERLFAQLMQVSGRAGRVARKEGGSAAEVLVQTRYPQHPLYDALVAHDYERFAAALLEERRHAALPPFMYQALLRAEAAQLQLALDFLQGAATCLEHQGITINDPIPMSMARVANVERAQLLVESASRPALQAFLAEWIGLLRKIKTRGRWSLEVDPVDI